ncbi:MAG: tripartite tricarboxylate transporter substrate binding protein [Betaproteobacteria bacterium]|nr:tripartite tricarboxylate transporter substrate binding protein [Betaproteobacteria bacterium]
MNFPNFGRVIVIALSTIAWSPAYSQFPVRAVTLVVPYPPGGGTDAGARLIASKLTERWGQATIVENKPGAAGIPGAEWVAKSKPDGYTLLMGDIGTQAINPSLHKKLPYDADHAFAPVSLVAELPLVLLIHPSVNAKLPRDLIGLAKAKPGQLAYSSSGIGGSMHLAAVLFEGMARVQLFHVPQKGVAPAISELVGGRVNLSFATVLDSIGHIKAGSLRALAVTSAQRLPSMPALSTVAESGVPGYISTSWIGVLAPAGTSAAIVDKIAKDIQRAVTTPDVQHKLIEQGAVPVGSSPAQFRALIDRDRRRYARLIQEKNITAE